MRSEVCKGECCKRTREMHDDQRRQSVLDDVLSSLGLTERKTVSSFSGTLLHSSLFTLRFTYFILRSLACYSHTGETRAADCWTTSRSSIISTQNHSSNSAVGSYSQITTDTRARIDGPQMRPRMVRPTVSARYRATEKPNSTTWNHSDRFVGGSCGGEDVKSACVLTGGTSAHRKCIVHEEEETSSPDDEVWRRV